MLLICPKHIPNRSGTHRKEGTVGSLTERHMWEASKDDFHKDRRPIRNGRVVDSGEEVYTTAAGRNAGRTRAARIGDRKVRSPGRK